MILHKLMIEDFRGVIREEVEVPALGVLVIEGPNESGKTSLMDSLEMLLEHKASSGRAEIKAASPVGRDVPVVVEAEFTVDGERMRYRKEFVRGKRTSLEFLGSARTALSGDDAHDHVRELLDSRVDRSLWKALRIAQDEPIGQVDAAKGMDSLRRALDTAAGGEDPTGDDSLVDRVAEERNRYLTAKKGEPTGDLARSQARVEEAAAELTAARARHAELDAAVEDHAARASVHEARRVSLAAVEAEVTRLEEAGRAVAVLSGACTAAEAEVDRAVAVHDARQREQRERDGLVESARRDETKEAELRAAAVTASNRLEPADLRAREARSALEKAEESVTRGRRRLDAVRASQERERRRTDLANLEARLETLRTVGEELEEKEAALVEVKLTDGAVDKLRAADEELREAIIRSSASAPRVELSGTGSVRVGGEEIDVAEAWSSEIVEDTVFEMGTVSLTVVPAGDTDAVRREELAARTYFESLLETFGVQSPAEAEQRAHRAGGLRAEIDALRRRRGDLLGGDTSEDLVNRRDSLLAEEQEDPSAPSETTDTETGETADPDAADPVAEAVAAEKELARCRAEDRAATAEVGALRTEYATRLALADEAAARLKECRQALETARAGTDDSELADAESHARTLAEAAREAARAARTELDEALAAAPPELLANARASLTALVAEERESAEAVAAALGRVNAIGDQGRFDDVSVSERELEMAERENTALWRRARAADLLHRTLVTRRSEALQAYQAPFHKAVVELGSLVYGRDFDVRLGEDLTILSRRIGDVTVDYESLSGGAREQLAVIVRIACARLVGEGGVPVFLDDTMGYTDPSRRMTMGAVIAAAAATSQVIVLTCDRARFAGIGGARTHVMGRTTRLPH